MILNMGAFIPKLSIDAKTITPGITNQVIEKGTYLKGALTILGDADLVAKNIKKGVNIFGVTGTLPEQNITIDGVRYEDDLTLKSKVMNLPLDDIPINSAQRTYPQAINLDDGIHLLIGSAHYLVNNNTYVKLVDSPFYTGESTTAVRYKGKMYAIASNKLYRWDNTVWTQVSTLPGTIYWNVATEHNGLLHVATDMYTIYTWDETSWVKAFDTSDSMIRYLISSGNVLYRVAYSSKRQYLEKYIDSSWVTVETVGSSSGSVYVLTDLDGSLVLNGTRIIGDSTTKFTWNTYYSPSYENDCIGVRNGEMHGFSTPKAYQIINAKLYREVTQ